MSLQEQLTQLQQQIATEKQRGAEHDRFLVAQWEAQEAALLEQIMNEQVEQNHEVRIAESHQKVAYILDSLQVGGLTLRQLSAGEDEFELLYSKIVQLFEVQAESASNQIKGYEERESQLIRQNNNLQNRLTDAERENSRLSAWANEQETRANDAEAKRDAAVRAAEETKAENEQLKSWNDDLQLQIQRGVSGAIRVVDAEEEAKRAVEEQERIERVKAQRTIYDVVPDNDINPKNYTAKKVIDGEEINFNWTQKNSYIVLTDEAQVNSFRLQHQTQALPDSSLDHIATPPIENVVEESQFQEAGPDMAVSTSSDQEAVVSREEYTALRHEVTMLAVELKARGILPHNWEAVA